MRIAVAPFVALCTFLLVGCATLLGADFDRPPSGASLDGNATEDAGSDASSCAQAGNCDAGAVDPCVVSPASCIPRQPCDEDAGASRACDKPPLPACSDPNTLRTFGAAGTCKAGACDYPHTDTPCENGCAGGACVATQRIAAAANVGDVCESATTEDLLITADRTLDTAAACTQVVTQDAGVPEICVLRYRDVKIAAGATLKLKGTRALALVATRAVGIDGTLEASATGKTGGPGAFTTGAGVGGEYGSQNEDAHSGGGGHGTAGAAGGDACVHVGGLRGMAGGQALGSETLVPLTAGSRGGGPVPSDYGAGGGAVQLVACGRFALGATGVISANGGGGGAGICHVTSYKSGAGGGGGSGGGILIEAASVQVSTGAAIVANGGGGGAGNGFDGSSNCTDGSDGTDGLVSSTPAPGGSIGGTGGNGGAGTAAPTPGKSSNDCAAGNGGGAVGRIRINLPGGVLFPQTGALVSPPATFGVVTVK